MTDQQTTLSQNAGRAFGLARNWIDAVEGRSRAIVQSAIMALPPLAAWAYGVSHVTPAKCTVSGGRYMPCAVMSEAKPPFPIGWNGLLIAAFAIALVVGILLIMRPLDRNARLIFGAAGAVIAAVSGIQLVMLMGMPNAAQVFVHNSAWLVVPGAVGTAAAFAAISSRS